MTSKEIAKIAYNAIDDKKGIDISVIDISEVSILADYFIIAGGNNENQVKAIADNVMEELDKAGFNAKSMEGYNNANWILMDYNDVIIHIFNQDERLFYDLERIWRDGKSIRISDLQE